jgi:hypothetical protein
MLRFSKLVTIGQMSRKEALEKIAANKAKLHEPDNFQWFLDTLKITRENFNKVISEPLKHMKYMKQRSPIKRRLKHLKSKLIP